jgi:hypothetical protein
MLAGKVTSTLPPIQAAPAFVTRDQSGGVRRKGGRTECPTHKSETTSVQVLIRQNEKDGTIKLQPSALAQSTEFLEITVYADHYCLETMADQGLAQSTAEVRTLAEIDQHITAFLIRMNVS